MSDLGNLGQIIEDWKNSQPVPPRDAAIARRLGVSRTWFGKWMRGESAPNVEDMRKLATLVGLDQWVLMRAALLDEGYDPDVLPREA